MKWANYTHKPTGLPVRAAFAENWRVIPPLGPVFFASVSVFERDYIPRSDDRDATPLWEASVDQIFEEVARRFDSVAFAVEKDNLSDVRVSGSFNACHGLAAEIQEIAHIQKSDQDGLVLE